MSNNKQQPEQDDNKDSGLMTWEQAFQKLRADIRSWPEKDKQAMAQAIMDKTSTTSRTKSETENLGCSHAVASG